MTQNIFQPLLSLHFFFGIGWVEDSGGSCSIGGTYLVGGACSVGVLWIGGAYLVGVARLGDADSVGAALLVLGWVISYVKGIGSLHVALLCHSIRHLMHLISKFDCFSFVSSFTISPTSLFLFYWSPGLSFYGWWLQINKLCFCS